MPARHLSLRFDVDSHRCVATGMPALLDLGRELDVRFTFFVNFGRLTARHRVLRTALRRGAGASSESAETIAKLPLRAKLGTRDLAIAAVANPRAGAAHLDVVRRAIDEGHDVGLHGGRNHRVWQQDANTWSRQRVDGELTWGLAWLARAGGGAVGRGFSSPGWTTSPVVAQAVHDAGFAYLADRHGPDEGDVTRLPAGLVDVPTNILGEPGGVGWLEWCRAVGDDDHALEERFARRLDDLGPARHAVVYDHPFHAGIADLESTRRLVLRAREDGWLVTTMASMAGAVA